MFVFEFSFVFSERIDNEIAQEIQEQLVRQAEKQKQQEAKDEVRIKGSVTDYQGHVTERFFFSFFSQEKKIALLRSVNLPRQGVTTPCGVVWFQMGLWEMKMHFVCYYSEMLMRVKFKQTTFKLSVRAILVYFAVLTLHLCRSSAIKTDKFLRMSTSASSSITLCDAHSVEVKKINTCIQKHLLYMYLHVLNPLITRMRKFLPNRYIWWRHSYLHY